MALEKITFGRYLEDFEEGMIIEHPLSKTITESDNNLFSLLTMNHHPVHLDMEYVKAHQHGKILVVGTLVFSLAVGLTVSEISGQAIANLEYLHVKHLGPTFLNDTISVKTTVLSKKESKSKNDRGVVHVRSEVTNQNSDLILTFERKVLVKKKDAHS